MGKYDKQVHVCLNNLQKLSFPHMLILFQFASIEMNELVLFTQT